MTDQPAHAEDDGPVEIKLNITMHGEGTVTLSTVALGLKPLILVNMTPSEEGEPDALHLEVDVYACGTSKDDVRNVGQMLELIAEAIKDKADEAYVVSTEGGTDGETADDDLMERPEPDGG